MVKGWHKYKTICEHPSRESVYRGLCGTCYARLKSRDPQWRRKKLARQARYLRKQKELQRQYPISLRTSSRYGLSIEDATALYQKQNGLCACCRKPPKQGQRLHVDHDHQTGKVRALLCVACNNALARLEHPHYPLWLAYLRQHGKPI